MYFTSFLATLVVCILQINADTPLDGQFNLRFDYDFRPPYPPLEYCQWENYTQLACARHHIYPRNRLATFYNTLLENNQLSNLRQFFRSYKSNFEEYYNSLDPNQNKITIQNVQELVEGILQKTVIHNSSASRPNSFDDFGAYFTWLPKDLFVGLDNRSDDPGDAFETKSKYIIGDDDFAIIDETKDLIEAYLAGNKTSVYNIDEKFALLFKKPSGNKGVLLPYPYEEKDWGRNANGTYYIKKKKSKEDSE